MKVARGTAVIQNAFASSAASSLKLRNTYFGSVKLNPAISPDFLKSIQSFKVSPPISADFVKKYGAANVNQSFIAALRNLDTLKVSPPISADFVKKYGAANVNQSFIAALRNLDTLKVSPPISAELLKSIEVFNRTERTAMSLATTAGLISTNKDIQLVKKMLESALSVNLRLPRDEWLKAASISNERFGMGVSIRELGTLANRIATQTSTLMNGKVLLLGFRPSINGGVSAWAKLARQLPDTPSPLHLERLTLAGSGTLAMLDSGSILTTGLESSNSRFDGIAVIEDDKLRNCFARLGAPIVARWDGARERASKQGPDAASQVAHSLVELIDQSLRLAAPDALVIEWHKNLNRPESELRKMKPTRSLRVRFLLRDREGDLECGLIYIRSLVSFVDVLQKKKHDSAGDDLLAVQRMIPGIEAILYFIFGYE
jgi:hypothetical protein